MKTKKRKKNDQMVKKLKKAMKVLWLLTKVVFWIICSYVFYKRCQDIHGIEFFFTTWQ